MFNPRPRIEAFAITPTFTGWVVDDALLEPERLVEFAAAQRAQFVDAPHNAYPGPELRLPESVVQSLERWFSLHLRDRLGLRRVQRATARLSLTTYPPHTLQPRQSICHVDRLETQPGQRIVASVLYLFDDPALGGTSFYMPRRPIEEIAALMRDSASMSAAQFEASHGIAPGYMVESNAWFQRVATVPARFNRLIAYSGTIFHSGDIRRPDLLRDDPRTGRLSLNGFFVGSSPLTA
ncbi:DUF6445 family protein [Cognatilysobacter bugurensis]|uniref:Uncharacterized protein n=1 Tax=Cognatilysobacter bugurensis TaxID=543356 RepID=A0A918T088_9GAMM|nr:DUF6445 family protein [Lysobacter bugurensis]GHA81760.1 hypothetical protein GCM10007067_19550 [Lysobacter bugurensis]